MTKTSPRITPDKILHQNARRALQSIGQAALEHIMRDRQGHLLLTPEDQPTDNSGMVYGGPFSAGVSLIFPDGSIELIGEPKYNTVLGKGVASFHAEHEALCGYPYGELIKRLDEIRMEGGPDVYVLILSSAQSCTTCQTKQELVARDLIRHGLVAPGHFLTLYGASYDETLEVAQFNDKIYAEAMILAATQPEAPSNLLHQRTAPFESLPTDIQRLFAETRRPIAVVEREGNLYATGTEARTDTDLFSTAEVVALRNAGVRYQQETGNDPWLVDGTLYTTTLEMGPLFFAEAGWTRLSDIVHVVMPPVLAAKQLQTEETYGIDNATFFNIIAGGYAHPDRAVNVYRDQRFENTAQVFWTKLLRAGKAKLYNGAAGTSATEEMSKLTQDRFTAPDFSTFE